MLRIKSGSSVYKQTPYLLSFWPAKIIFKKLDVNTLSNISQLAIDLKIPYFHISCSLNSFYVLHSNCGH